MRPKLSIITVNFNNNSGLSKTLESVRHQSFSSYEHIIIDAGSKDGSLETIKQYAEGNPHVTFWVSEPDKGRDNPVYIFTSIYSHKYLLLVIPGKRQ